MIFVVLSANRPTLLEPVIESAYPNDAHLKVRDGQWLVVDSNITSHGVAEKLGILGQDPNTVGSALVVGLSGYSGRQPANVWEWIRAKLEAK